MTDIQQKARELVNKVLNERGMAGRSCIDRDIYAHEALCRAIEQREAAEQKAAETKQELSDFRQEVSDEIQSQPPAVRDYLGHFIIPAPKPDLLVEAMKEIGVIPLAGNLRSALEARGLEIREKNDDQ